MLKNINILAILLALFSCNNNNEEVTIVGLEDTLFTKPNSVTKTKFIINNKTFGTITVLDSRMSCDCIIADSFAVPFDLNPKSIKEIGFLVKTDRKEIGKVKSIVITLKYNKEPFFVSKNLIVKVLKN